MTSPTDLNLLIQACRNLKGKAWRPYRVDDICLGLFINTREKLGVFAVREEYNRLLRLKKRKKKAA